MQDDRRAYATSEPTPLENCESPIEAAAEVLVLDSRVTRKVNPTAAIERLGRAAERCGAAAIGSFSAWCLRFQRIRMPWHGACSKQLESFNQYASNMGNVICLGGTYHGSRTVDTFARNGTIVMTGATDERYVFDRRIAKLCFYRHHLISADEAREELIRFVDSRH